MRCLQILLNASPPEAHQGELPEIAALNALSMLGLTRQTVRSNVQRRVHGEGLQHQHDFVIFYLAYNTFVPMCVEQHVGQMVL